MLFDQPEPMEPGCDAPPYSIVRACRRLGFRAPEDVRWCHLVGRGPVAAVPVSGFNLQSLKALFHKTEPKRASCHCGQGLPRLDRCSFTLASGRQVDYLLGQCPRCQAIFWQETQPDLLAH